MGSGPEQPPPDGGPANVTVLVENAGVPVAGASVRFYEADGTPDGTVTTGADGTAHARIGAGASATTTSVFTGVTYYQTVLGLQPGDEAHLGDPHVRPDVDLAATVTVTFAAQPGASSYVAVADCGASSQEVQASPATLLLSHACVGVPIHVALIAKTANVTSHYTAPHATTIAADGTLALAEPWQALTSSTVTLPDLKQPDFDVTRCAWLGCTQVIAESTSGGSTATLPFLPLDPTIVRARFWQPNGTAHAPIPAVEQIAVQHVPASTTAITLAAAAFLSLSTMTLDPTTRAVTVTSPGGDLLALELTTSDGGIWQIVGPPSASFTLPPLPAGVTVVPSDPTQHPPSRTMVITTLDLASVAGWDAMRAHAWGIAFASYEADLGDYRRSTFRQ